MEKGISVVLNGDLYVWVDTLVKTDEYEYTVAVLVDPKYGTVLTRDISTIRVIDKDIVD